MKKFEKLFKVKNGQKYPFLACDVA